MQNSRSFFATKNSFRPVNPTLGKTPKLGPFPGDQVAPWTGIFLLSYYVCKFLLGLSWLWTGLVAGWGCATWWILTANGAWWWLSKFIPVPNWTRGFAIYKPVLVDSPVIPSQTSRRRLLIKTQQHKRKNFKAMKGRN